MSLVFYYAPQSTAVTTHHALLELDVPFEAVRLDLAAGDARKPDFLALNPNGKVPLLVHDGVPICESAAIQIHLGEAFGVERGLYPPPGPERGRAHAWLVWCNVSAGGALLHFQRNTAPQIPAEQQSAAAGEVGRAEVERHLGILDAALADRAWMLGDTFSLADAHLGCFTAYVGMVGFDLSAGRWPHLARWLEAVRARPAFQAAMSA